jgi:hypothetical protein
MIWLFLSILISILILFILLYPFKIIVFNDNKYIYIKISFFITLKLNIYALFDESNIKELQKQTRSLKLIKKLITLFLYLGVLIPASYTN